MACALDVQQQARVDELAGEEPAVGVGKRRLQLDRAGGGVHLVVDRQQRAARELAPLLAVVGVHRHRGAARDPVEHGGDAVLGDGEDDGDRLQLRDHDEAVGVGRVHDVAGIHLAQPGPPADGRRDAAIGELDPDALEQAAIVLHRALVLADERALGVELLLGNRIGAGQRLVAREIEARVLQQGLVAGELALVLRQLRLEGPRVDLGQQVALADQLPLAELHAQQLAVDPRVDGDGVQRRDGAEARDVDADVTGPHRRHHHRCRARRRRRAAPGAPPRPLRAKRPYPPTASSARASGAIRHAHLLRVELTTAVACAPQCPCTPPSVVGLAPGLPRRSPARWS